MVFFFRYYLDSIYSISFDPLGGSIRTNDVPTGYEAIKRGFVIIQLIIFCCCSVMAVGCCGSWIVDRLLASTYFIVATVLVVACSS